MVAHIQYQSDRYIPAGIPSKRHPGAPADALDMHYDTVPFELFPSNFPAVCPVDIAPGTGSATYDLTFDSGIVRTDTVRDREGRPLSGVSMLGESYQYGSLFQFKPLDGPEFTVYGLSPSPLLPRTLIFRHADRRLGQTVRVDGRETGPIEVRLEPTASVTGRLLEQAGRPLDGIDLHIFREVREPTRGAHGDFSPPIQAKTHSQGRFRIDEIVPGAVQKVQAAGFQAGPSGFLLEEWTPKPGEVKDLGQIRPQ